MSVTGRSSSAAASKKPRRASAVHGPAYASASTRARGQLSDRLRDAGRGRAGDVGVVDRRDRQAVVAAPRLAGRQGVRIAAERDDAAGGERDCVLVERLARRGLLEPGRVQRQRAAERAAEIVALGQLARVALEQRAGAGEQDALQRSHARHAQSSVARGA